MTFETFDQSDEEIWPDQQKDNDKDKHNDNYKDNANNKDMWPSRHLIWVVRWQVTKIVIDIDI